MAKERVGVLTWFVIALGLAIFLVLALWPGMGMIALYIILITPLAAAAVTGAELIYDRRLKSGSMLLLSVAIIVIAVLWGVR
jgi:hypothetical protein